MPAAGGRELQPIRLRAEAPNATATSAADSSGSGLLAAACVSIGPFIDPAHAAAANAQLERLGFTSRRRVSQDEVRVGYWVRVPNLATPADATNALAALRAAGLGDAYVLAEGEPDNTVSVGVFADPRRAAEVSAMVQKAGFTRGNERSPADAGSALARHRSPGERRPAVARGAGRAAGGRRTLRHAGVPGSRPGWRRDGPRKPGKCACRSRRRRLR